MRTSVFRDDALNRRFLNNGYVIVPFLTAAEVAEVRDGFEQLSPQTIEPLHRSQLDRDIDYRKSSDELIHRVFDPRIDALLNEYQAVVASFIVKEAREPASTLDLHADTSLVDETKFMSANLWCPLVDTSPRNGGLRIIPGSEHHYFPMRLYSCRAGVRNHPFDDVMPLMKDYTRELEVPAGHAVVYSSRLIHGSGPNMSDTRRIAVVCVNTPKEAPIRLSVPTSDATRAETFEIADPSVFIACHIDEPVVDPRAKSLGITDYQLAQLTRSEVRKSPHLRPRPASLSGLRRLLPFG